MHYDGGQEMDDLWTSLTTQSTQIPCGMVRLSSTAQDQIPFRVNPDGNKIPHFPITTFPPPPPPNPSLLVSPISLAYSYSEYHALLYYQVYFAPFLLKF